MSKNHSIKKKRLNAEVSESLYEQFQITAKRQGRTVSGLIRDIITNYVESNRLDQGGLIEGVPVTQHFWTEHGFDTYWGKRFQKESARMIEMKKEIMSNGGFYDVYEDLKERGLTGEEAREYIRRMSEMTDPVLNE